MKNDEVIVIGIAGGSGSGKTFFAEALYKKLGPEKAALIYQDNYYIDQSHLFDQDGGAVNFDHPSSLDFDLMAEHLKELKKNNPVNIPLYDFKTHQRLTQTKIQEVKKVIIIDGILILTQPHLRELFTESIFVETPEEIRFQRRLERDVTHRGRTPEGVKAQFNKQVKPMHDLFVEPSKEFATHISSGTDMDAFYSMLKRVINMIENNNDDSFVIPHTIMQDSTGISSFF